MSLVGLLAHGYLINKTLGNPTLLATALSVVPPSGFPPVRTDLNYLEKLVKWASNRFKVKTPKMTLRFFPGMERILRCISTGEAESFEELVYSCIAICRSLGILTRLVLSLQPLPAKVDSSELQPKSQDGKKTKEKKDKSNTPEKTEACEERASNSKSTKVSKPTTGKE